MSDLAESIARLQHAYGDAVFARDAHALLRLYDPQARVFDAWGVWLYQGADAWRRAVEAWFDSLGTETVKVRFEDTESFAGPELAFSSAIVSYVGLSSGGEELRSMQNRMTWGLRRSGAGLRILHEHTSAPVGFEDLKAILQRDAP